MSLWVAGPGLFRCQSNELVEAAVLEILARLSFLYEWQVFGKTGGGSSLLYEALIWFHDFIPGGSSVLTPMIHGASPVPDQGSGFYVSMRPCYPYGSSVEYRMDWGDGSSDTTISASPGSNTFIAHDFSSPGTRTLQLTAVRDSLGRTFNSARTDRTVSVVVPDAPGIPSSITASATSSSAIDVSWGPSSGFVQSYILEQRRDSGGWTQVVDADVRFRQASGLSNGLYSFRAKACNSGGCSLYRSSNSVRIGPAPMSGYISRDSTTAYANISGGDPAYSYVWYRRPTCGGGGGGDGDGDGDGDDEPLPFGEQGDKGSDDDDSVEDVPCNAWYGPFYSGSQWQPYSLPNQSLEVVVNDSTGNSITVYSWAD